MLLEELGIGRFLRRHREVLHIDAVDLGFRKHSTEMACCDAVGTSRILDGCLRGNWNTFPPMAETRQACSRWMGRSVFRSLGFGFEVLTGEGLEDLDLFRPIIAVLTLA